MVSGTTTGQPVKGLGHSSSRPYMTSQRSSTTLPPINDFRSPRKSLPVINAQTPTVAPASERASITKGAFVESSRTMHPPIRTPALKILPKVNSNPDTLFTPVANSALTRPVL